MPFRLHQYEPIIKTYKMTLENLASWRKKFLAVRYKYFGHRHSEFPIPKGCVRAEDGTIKIYAIRGLQS